MAEEEMDLERNEIRLVTVGTASLAVAVLPFFLVGAVAVSLRDDLGIGETAIGALGTVMFVAGGVLATPAGRLVDRAGAGFALRAGAAVATAGAGAVAGLVGRWWHLAVVMVAAGGAVALVDTGAAKAFADGIRSNRQGSAFGVKEASIPAATMLAGLAVPVLVSQFGWRAGFVAAGVLAAVVCLAVPRRDTFRTLAPAGESVAGPNHRPPRQARRFAIGVALGAGAAMGAAVFLVTSLVDAGLGENRAALVLTLASTVAIAVRVVVGIAADGSRLHPVVLMSGLLALGTVSAGVLALPAPPAVRVVGAVALMGGAWGWTGLAFLAVVRGNTSTPGAAAGTVLTGLSAGSACGPLTVGALAEHASFTIAYAVVAVVLGAAALTTYSVRPGARHEAVPLPKSL